MLDSPIRPVLKFISLQELIYSREKKYDNILSETFTRNK